ncbi:PP2C family protein-serine/threonine phosphatase [Actinacidiphila soli]|uniref:PP2C family protein-serine/threonine phosphatase n=1 Tax=Actinacidiphila soli TaxID=2487275 RepID=UPI001F0BA125|nr:PP2C family protein-serine/threonine phosphatase [Actinacidiphila soli]
MGNRRKHRQTALARRLPALLIVAGVVFELATPPGFTASPILAVAPMVAAPLLSWLGTAATGLAAVGADVGLTAYHHHLGDPMRLTAIATIAAIAVLALGVNRLITQSDRRLKSARDIAAAAQVAVLPPPPSRLPGLTVAARYVAAESDAQIGGDLYAVQDTPHGVRLIVGDVRGKGMGAVQAVAVIIGAFREAAEQEPTLDGVSDRLERALERAGELRRGTLDQTEGFTTALLAELRPGDDRLRLINRGHPPPLVVHPDGAVNSLDPDHPAMPLGMSALGRWPDVVDLADFPPGSTLLVFTDGVTEARDARGRFYDPEVALAGRVFSGPDALLDALITDVEHHTGGMTVDDMAVLALTRRRIH